MVSSLDHVDGSLLDTLLRFEETLQAPIHIGDLHDHAQRMRNSIVPWVTIGQVRELDAILGDPSWDDRSQRLTEFKQGYFLQGDRKTAIPSRWLEDTST